MSNEKPAPEEQFVERYNPIDDILSTHSELLRSVEYSNEKLYSTEKLEELGLYWLDEETNPIRSERSQAAAKQITRLLAFECAYRKSQIPMLIEFFGNHPQLSTLDIV